MANLHGNPVVRECRDWESRWPNADPWEQGFARLSLSPELGEVALVTKRDFYPGKGGRTTIEFASGRGASVNALVDAAELLWDVVLESARRLTFELHGSEDPNDWTWWHARSSDTIVLETWMRQNREALIPLKQNGWPAGVMSLRSLGKHLHQQDPKEWHNKKHGPPAPQTLSGMLVNELARLLLACCTPDNATKPPFDLETVRAVVKANLGDTSKKGRVHERRAPAYDACEATPTHGSIDWAEKRRLARKNGWRPPRKDWYLD